MNKIKTLLVATVVSAAFGAATLQAVEPLHSPRAQDSHIRKVPATNTDADFVHGKTVLGNAAGEKAQGHRVVAGSSQQDPDLFKMIRECRLSPKQIGDTPACKACCMKTEMK